MKITKKVLFVFVLTIFAGSLAQGSSLPPIINFILNQDTSVFDSTVVPIPDSGAYHGVYTILDNAAGSFTIERRLEGIASFEQSVYQTQSNSRRVVFDRQFYRWDSFLRDDNIHPYLLASAELGRTPVASITPRLRNGSVVDCPDGSDKLAWPCIADGFLDDHIILIAQRIRDSGVSPFVFTFTHEPEDEIRCNDTDNCMGTAADYVAAWQRIVTLFRQQQANNVDFMWITRHNIYGETVPNGFPTADEIYPGDDYIDWIAADVYNFAFGSNWQPLSEVASEFYAWGSQRPKPLAFGEWGSREEYFNADNDGSRKETWFDEARQWLKTQGTRIKAIMYFNIYAEGEFNNPDEFGNTGPDWRIDTTDKSLEGYRRLAQDPYFISIDAP